MGSFTVFRTTIISKKLLLSRYNLENTSRIYHWHLTNTHGGVVLLALRPSSFMSDYWENGQMYWEENH